MLQSLIKPRRIPFLRPTFPRGRSPLIVAIKASERVTLNTFLGIAVAEVVVFVLFIVLVGQLNQEFPGIF